MKHNNWLFADTCPQAADHCALFESETNIRLYNLKARSFINIVVSLYLVLKVILSHGVLFVLFSFFQMASYLQ